jgi:hypothetical protein
MNIKSKSSHVSLFLVGTYFQNILILTFWIKNYGSDEKQLIVDLKIILFLRNLRAFTLGFHSSLFALNL